MFINTLRPTFIFKAMDINHQSCPSSYKFSNDLNKTICLHSTINIYIYINMLVELCASNYATFDGLVNGIDGIFKTSTTYCEKTIIWIMFQKFKIGTLIRKKNHYYNNIDSKWTLIEPIFKDIKIGKSQSFIIIII